jgi:ubiquinone/menaquinone biosynthesis C-methylase UbiE
VRKRVRLKVGLAVFIALAGTVGYGLLLDAFPRNEVMRLMELLGAGPGTNVAEVGAGRGRMTRAAAGIIGPGGQFYATELGEAKIRALAEAAKADGAGNVTIIEGGEASVNLPASCCDAIYLYKVYHHFTQPTELNASIYQALRPGGRLAVIDFEPRWWRFWLPLPEGVPINRGGHGMPITVLIDELESAGFVLERTIPDWWAFPESRFCVVFRKP